MVSVKNESRLDVGCGCCGGSGREDASVVAKRLWCGGRRKERNAMVNGSLQVD